MSFVGKIPEKMRDRVMEYIDTKEDPELLELYISRLRNYLDTISKILEDLSYQPPSPADIEELHEASQSLIAASRYMGFKGIETELNRITNTTEEIINNTASLTGETISIIVEAQEKLVDVFEAISEGLSRITDTETASEEMEYNLLSLAQCWSELNDLYKDTGELIRTVTQEGELSDTNKGKLKDSTSKIDEIANSIARLLEVMK
jgi:septation ring formation regulator EzrA